MREGYFDSIKDKWLSQLGHVYCKQETLKDPVYAAARNTYEYVRQHRPAMLACCKKQST